LARDEGKVAVIEDDGTLITEKNNFNLSNGSLRFEPVLPENYLVTGSTTPSDSYGGSRIVLGDDDAVEVELGFSFVFFGQEYTSVFLNSDGNLTFLESDTASTARDLGRFSSGPPRIGPLFADLDPNFGTVSRRSDGEGIQFIWSAVRNFGSFSTNSFGVKLFRNGTMEFLYGSVETAEAVVGISPGAGQGGIAAVDYAAEPPDESFGGTIVEVFSPLGLISEPAIAQRFLQSHPDEFDQIIVFLAFDYDIGGNAFAYEINVRNPVRGIGLPLIDDSQSYGSAERLKSFVMMGSLDGSGRFPADPNQKFMRTYNTLEVLAHEVGHRWLAYPFIQLSGVGATSLLWNTDLAHWSFFFNANASVMEGNLIEDRGAGLGSSRFRTMDVTNRYSPLDLYLMGFESPDRVPNMFFVTSPTGTFRDRSSVPTIGETFGGTRRDFSVDNIILSNGSRRPTAFQSQKVHRQAFILLTRPGQAASQEQIDKLQKVIDAWEPFFNEKTDGQGFVVTTLQTIPGTTTQTIHFPYFQGNGDRYTGFALANWGSTPADVLFRTFDNDGFETSTPIEIINPRMITIPPGSQVAMLGSQIHGLSLDVPREGWVQAESTSSQVTGFFLDGDVDLNVLDGAVAGTDVQTSLFFTRASRAPGKFLGESHKKTLSIINPSLVQTRLEFELIAGSGEVLASAERILNARSRLAEEVTSLFPGAASDPASAYIKLESNEGVIGYESIEGEAAVFALPAQPAGNATRLYSAQFASGPAGDIRYFTDLNLINTLDEDRRIEVLLVDNAGAPVESFANPFTLDLSGSGQFRARGDLMFGLPDPALSAALTEGTLIISADGPGIIGDITFGDPINERFLASLPLNGEPIANMVLSQVAQGSPNEGEPYFTGIAMYNPNSESVTISLEVFSATGARTGSRTLVLEAGHRISKTLPELIPGLTEQVRGQIHISVEEGPIVTFELFGDQALDFLAAVPPQAININ
jgi:hypothetical protein